jgi:glycosyltransferase involved in cell wall biosynthesis
MTTNRHGSQNMITEQLESQSFAADVPVSQRDAAEISLPSHRGDDTVSYRSKLRLRRASQWPKVSVVIPTLNEALNLPLVLAEIPDDTYEILIVDGHSTDGTPDVAREIRPDAIVIQQDGRGKGDALRCGFEAATGDILVMLDADGSADPAEIPQFVQALLEGADFAKGTRFLEAGGSSDLTPLRKFGNRVLSGTVNMLFRTSYSDLCYGYNAFWRHCLPTIDVDCTGFEIETLINIRIARAGLKVQEIPSFERDRVHGQSNLRTFRDGARVLRTILTERAKGAPRSDHPRTKLDLTVTELGFAGEGA